MGVARYARIDLAIGGAAALALAIAGAVVAACKAGPAPVDPLDAAASPQAQAIPAPLGIVPVAPTSLTSSDAGPPPVALRGDVPFPADPIAKDIGGYALQAVVRPIDVTAPPPDRTPGFPPRGPEVSAAGLDAARRRTEGDLTIELTPARMRVLLASSGFVWPEGTELRARADRYGHFVVWPGGGTYRPLAPGTLRSFFDDRRVDVFPLVVADAIVRGEGTRRLGFRTHRVDVAARDGKASFDIARVVDLGEGGPLLCRMLLELMGALPSTPLCMADDLPLHAEVRWSPPPPSSPPGSVAAGMTFDVTVVARRSELAPAALAAPPATAVFAAAPLPPVPAATLLAAPELAAFRNAPIDVPAAATTTPGDLDPQGGLLLVNATDALRFVWADGVPIAWIAPGGRHRIPALLRGRYVLQWRTFLGDAVGPQQAATVPGASILGDVDAGL